MSTTFVPKLLWVDTDDPNYIKRRNVHSQVEAFRARRIKRGLQWKQQQFGVLDEWGIQHGAPINISSKETRIRHSDLPSSTIHAPLVAPRTPEGYQRGETSGLNMFKNGSRSQSAATQGGNAIQTTQPPQGLCSPQNYLTTSRREPFKTLPVILDDRSEYLLSHFLLDIPRIVHGIKHSEPNQSVYYPLAATGPLAFRAILLVKASASVARLKGVQDTVESIEHRSSTIRAIHARLADPSASIRTSDEILVAVVVMAENENLYGFTGQASLHMKAAMSMLRQQGGPQVIDRENNRLALLVNWTDYMMVGPRALSELPAWSAYPPKNKPSHRLDPSVAYTDLEDLIDFLSNVEALARIRQRRRSERSLFDQNVNYDLRRILFTPGSGIHRMLSLPSDQNLLDINHVSIYCQVAGLMHLNAALWDYRDSPSSCEHFLMHINRLFTDSFYKNCYSLCLGYLVYYLLKSDFVEADHAAAYLSRDLNREPDPMVGRMPEKRSWFVGRIMRVIKLLSKESWSKSTMSCGVS